MKMSLVEETIAKKYATLLMVNKVYLELAKSPLIAEKGWSMETIKDFFNMERLEDTITRTLQISTILQTVDCYFGMYNSEQPSLRRPHHVQLHAGWIIDYDWNDSIVNWVKLDGKTVKQSLGEYGFAVGTAISDRNCCDFLIERPVESVYLTDEEWNYIKRERPHVNLEYRARDIVDTTKRLKTSTYYQTKWIGLPFYKKPLGYSARLTASGIDRQKEAEDIMDTYFELTKLGLDAVNRVFEEPIRLTFDDIVNNRSIIEEG